MPAPTAPARPDPPVPAARGADQWVSGGVRAVSDASVTVMVGAVLMALAASWGATWLMGGAGAVAPHWFYVPIILAAARFGVGGAILTGAVAGVVAGPFMPLDVVGGTAQTMSDWVSRAGFFIGLGALIALLIKGVSLARIERDAVARREHALVRQKVDFVEGVSHEFRTPLTVISGTLEILRGSDLAPADRRDLLDALDHSVNRLTTLMEILVVAGEAVGGGEEARAATDLDAVLWRQCEDLHQVLDAPGRVRISSPGSIWVVGDRRLVSLTVRSIVDNALRYSRYDALVDGVIEDDGRQVRLRVRDRGPGIDEDVARRAREAPVTRQVPERPGAGGLGVGLFAAARVMRRVGGNIGVAPHPEGGTEVVLTFRRAERDRRDEV